MGCIILNQVIGTASKVPEDPIVAITSSGVDNIITYVSEISCVAIV